MIRIDLEKCLAYIIKLDNKILIQIHTKDLTNIITITKEEFEQIVREVKKSESKL